MQLIKEYPIPCPCCGYEALLIEGKYSSHGFYHVVCGACGLTTPYTNEETAIKIWNRRPVPITGFTFVEDVFTIGCVSSYQLSCGHRVNIPISDELKFCYECGFKVEKRQND